MVEGAFLLRKYTGQTVSRVQIPLSPPTALAKRKRTNPTNTKLNLKMQEITGIFDSKKDLDKAVETLSAIGINKKAVTLLATKKI